MSRSKNTTPPFLSSLIAALLLLTPFFAGAETETSAPPEKPKNDANLAQVPAKQTLLDLPRPGDNGSPEVKVTVGAPRGSGSDLELSIFVPKDHIIRSTDQALKWELSQAIQTPVKLILTDDSIDPVVEKIVALSSRAGIHLIKLDSLSGQLEAGKSYDWIMQACSTKACDTPARDLIVRSYFKIDR